MVGFVRVLGVSAAAIGALLAQSGPASAAPGDVTPGTPLVGVCPIVPGASKAVTSVYPSGGIWAPYSIYDERSQLLGRLAPYQVTLSGVGLKSRHFVPGETYTKSGKPPSNLIECTFDGNTPGGPVHIDILGVAR
jgi:hypothetical protein